MVSCQGDIGRRAAGSGAVAPCPYTRSLRARHRGSSPTGAECRVLPIFSFRPLRRAQAFNCPVKGIIGLLCLVGIITIRGRAAKLKAWGLRAQKGPARSATIKVVLWKRQWANCTVHSEHRPGSLHLAKNTWGSELVQRAKRGVDPSLVFTGNPNAAGCIWPFSRSTSVAAGIALPSRTQSSPCDGASCCRSASVRTPRHIPSAACPQSS